MDSQISLTPNSRYQRQETRPMAIVEFNPARGTCKKCCTCGNYRIVYKAFRDDESCGYRGRNKRPTFWCGTCWEESLELTERLRAESDAKVAAILAEHNITL